MESRGTSSRRRGVRVRTYLTALVLLPLLGLVGFAVVEVHGQLQRANDAHQVESGVTSASLVASSRARVLDELVPTMARTAIRSPMLRSVIGAGSVSMASVGLSDAMIDRLRASTNASLDRLLADPATRSMARRL